MDIPVIIYVLSGTLCCHNKKLPYWNRNKRLLSFNYSFKKHLAPAMCQGQLWGSNTEQNKVPTQSFLLGLCYLLSSAWLLALTTDDMPRILPPSFEFYLELQSRIFKCLPALFNWTSHRHSKMLVNVLIPTYSQPATRESLVISLSLSPLLSTSVHLTTPPAQLQGTACSCTIWTPPFLQPITTARFMSPAFLPWALWYSIPTTIASSWHYTILLCVLS